MLKTTGSCAMIFFCGAAMAFAPTLEAAAQDAPPVADSAQQVVDVIYLKNGSIIRGTIIEQRPGESVLIRTSDGDQFRFRMDQVERIGKGSASGQLSGVSKKSAGFAVVLSVLVPGAGQVYNGQWLKAGGFILGMVGTAAVGSSAFCDPGKDCSGVLLATVGIFAWSVIDAANSASDINTKAALRSASLFVQPGAVPGIGGAETQVNSRGEFQVPALQLGMRVSW